MLYRKPVLRLSLLLSALTFSALGRAGECDLQDYAELDYQTTLTIMAASSCFSAESRQTALATAVREILDNNVMEETARALKALNLIQAYLDKEYPAPGSEQYPNAKALRDAIAGLKTSLLASENPESGLKARWKTSDIMRPPEALERLDFSTALTAERCARVSEGKCDREFEALANLVRLIYLANAAIDTYSMSYRDTAMADRKLRRVKWDSYYDDLTFQYFWELWANGLLLDITDNREVIDGNRVGFRSLPRKKLVLLHPDANLVYARNTAKEYDIGVTVEALGVEFFDFDADGRVKNPWGVSVLVAYMNEPDNTGYGWSAGLMFKYNGYSIGVTDNHGEVGVVFNINLAQRIFDIKQDKRRYYDSFRNRN